MHRSRLPEDTISDYAFIQQFFESMHHRLRQDVEAQYTGDEDINTVIAIAERLDSIHRSTSTYGWDKFEKQSNNTGYKKQEQDKKPKKKFITPIHPTTRSNERRKVPVSPVVA